MRKIHTLAAALAIASVGVSGAAAQGKGNAGAPKGPKTSTTVSHGTGGGRGAGAGKGHTASTSSTTTTASSGTGTGSGTTTTTTTPVAPPNALSMKLGKNPAQLAKVQAMLPEGMTLEAATAGFRNQGQFIAALNASKNQGVTFADLQQAMTVDGLSLGQAVKQLRNAPAEAPEAPQTTTTTTSTATQKSS